METLADIETLSAENIALRSRVAQLESENSILRIRSKLVVPPELTKVLSSLLHSRKVLVALFAVIQALVLEYLSVPDAVWQTIAALAVAVIFSNAHEDAAEKGAPQTTIFNSPTVTQETPTVEVPRAP